MAGKIIRMTDVLTRKSLMSQQPYDEAEAKAAEAAMEEFDKIAAEMDEDKIDEYILGRVVSKHTG